jgi:tetratricopeptide (TPR) repeat protein
MGCLWLVVVLATASPIDSSAVTFPGDSAFAALDYCHAVRSYDSLLVGPANRPETLWRLARVCVCIADTISDGDASPLYHRAEGYARDCIRLDPRCSQGWTWLAAALGNIAMDEGARRKVDLCHEIKCALDSATALNPSDDVAYSILGSFYRALGNVGWLEHRLADVFLGGLPEGGYRESEGALARAVQLAPGVIRHRYELGLLYLDMGRKHEAFCAFQTAIALHPLLAVDRSTQTRAAAALEKLKSDGEQ